MMLVSHHSVHDVMLYCCIMAVFFRHASLPSASAATWRRIARWMHQCTSSHLVALCMHSNGPACIYSLPYVSCIYVPTLSIAGCFLRHELWSGRCPRGGSSSTRCVWGIVLSCYHAVSLCIMPAHVLTLCVMPGACLCSYISIIVMFLFVVVYMSWLLHVSVGLF